jgi:peroxiredoxin Q/BCP
MNIGDKIPASLGKDQNGREVLLSDYAGKKFIIYFYPKDNTPGCTAEACSLRDNYEQFLEMGYVVIGVSKDSEASHNKFIEKYSLPFILIADTNHELCEIFGVWRKKKMAGREYMGIVRTTFVADENGIITDVIEKVNTKDASAQLFALLSGRDSINPV